MSLCLKRLISPRRSNVEDRFQYLADLDLAIEGACRARGLKKIKHAMRLLIGRPGRASTNSRNIAAALTVNFQSAHAATSIGFENLLLYPEKWLMPQD